MSGLSAISVYSMAIPYCDEARAACDTCAHPRSPDPMHMQSDVVVYKAKVTFCCIAISFLFSELSLAAITIMPLFVNRKKVWLLDSQGHNVKDFGSGTHEVTLHLCEGITC